MVGEKKEEGYKGETDLEGAHPAPFLFGLLLSFFDILMMMLMIHCFWCAKM